MNNNFLILASDDHEYADRQLNAEVRVVQKVINDNPGIKDIDWDDKMDIMVSEYVQKDERAPIALKIKVLMIELQARSALILQNHC